MLGSQGHMREFKLELTRQLPSGEKRPAPVCREYTIAQSLLLRWRKEFQDRGEAALTRRRLHSSMAVCSPTLWRAAATDARRFLR